MGENLQGDVQSNAKEAFASRDYFYIGGSYVDDGTGGHVFANQMYVEHLVPMRVSQKYPIILIHGGGQTGSNWLNKPDGKPGWATRLLEKGYIVYIIDKPSRGRSAFWNGSGESTRSFNAEIVQERFTAPKNYMLWPQAALHTQWPDEGVMGGKVFDAYYASVVQNPGSIVYQQRASQLAGVALLEKIGPAIIIAHSQGGPIAWLIADARPKLVKAIVSIEPAGPPFRDAVFTNMPKQPWGLTDIPLRYSSVSSDRPVPLQTEEVRDTDSEEGRLESCILQKEPARKLTNFEHIPISLVTAEASYHAVYDWCTHEFLKQAGIKVEWIKLANHDIRGNGHLMFMEKNSDDIVSLLERWISNVIER